MVSLRLNPLGFSDYETKITKALGFLEENTKQLYRLQIVSYSIPSP